MHHVESACLRWGNMHNAMASPCLYLNEKPFDKYRRTILRRKWLTLSCVVPSPRKPRSSKIGHAIG